MKKALGGSGMASEDIFNTDNLNDIPEDIQKNIINKNCNLSKDVLSLFLLKNELTVNEMVVGYYRVHKKIITRGNIIAKLFMLNKLKIIQKTPEKTWKLLTKQENEE